ncbi:MAG: lysophospholipid acyltransferase family protein [Qingshengfaniella sp.]
MKTLRKRWRRIEKRFQRNERVQSVLRRWYSRYIRFVFRTTKWERIGFESYEADIARGVPRILCCWHARLTLTPYLRDWSDHALAVLASEHADARIATADMRDLGIQVIELATSGSNPGAIRKAVAHVRNGNSLAIAVDGPMGPRGVAKTGAIVIGGLTGAQVVPCCYTISRSITLKTWDRFVLPLPWSRGVLAVGDGFVPPRKASPKDMQHAADRLGRLIDALTETCEIRMRQRKLKKL